MMLTLYVYQGCSTCRDAVKWLRDRSIAFEEHAIRETTPTVEELQQMLDSKVQLRALFNTSGMEYRAQGLKDKLPGFTSEEAFQLLRSNGMLVKRPFALDPARGVFLLGFKEAEWAKALTAP
ncbi:MAG: Spx/MgsR family RNA polymerase-binding regulatory protein [Roseimicrobium sp.]